MNNILITGCAGFIGFHLTLKLVKEKKTIVGIDNLNDYYDVNLKKTRLKKLKSYKNFFFVKGDISNKIDLFKKLKKYKISAIINLAAQAGVRNVFLEPDKYFQSNISGFYNILEFCKSRKIKYLFYASTSSVYGDNEIPFSENQFTDKPIQFYAASKKCNEIMAHSYYEMFNINSVGMRFFTVYGPWGRPDMSLYKFTKNIFSNKKIEIFNKGNHKRDFTYVDDVVNGIFLLLSTKIKGHNIFNIGNSKQVHLMEIIKILEKITNKKAKLKFLPMQRGDIFETKSNISKIKRMAGYRSSVDIKDGLNNFVKWYKQYHKVN